MSFQEGIFGSIAKIVVVAILLVVVLGPKFGLRLPGWFRAVERVTTVAWIIVAAVAIFGAVAYFNGVR